MKWNDLGRALTIGVVNQGVTSGTNLLLGVFLLRTLEPTQFGMYGVGIAISFFYVGIGNAVLLTQTAVNIAEKPASERLPYSARMLVLTFTFALLSTLVFAVALLAQINIFGIERQNINFQSSVAAVSVTLLVKEFLVKHCYNVRQEKWALSINVIATLTLAMCLTASTIIDATLTAGNTLLIYASAMAAGSWFGISVCKLQFRNHSLRKLKLDLAEAWRGGSLSVVSHVIISIRSQAHVIILTATIGPIAVATSNAARLLISPMNMLVLALSQALLPRMVTANLMRSDKESSIGTTSIRLLTGAAVLYSALVMASYEHIEKFLIGGKYGDIFYIVLMWSILSILSTYKAGIELLVVSRKEFSVQAKSNAIGALVALTCVFLLSSAFGVAGSIAGLCVAELTVICIMKHRGRRII